jgi:hypothetical protein
MMYIAKELEKIEICPFAAFSHHNKSAVDLIIGRRTDQLVHAPVADKDKNQNNQYDHAYAADGVIAPVPTVRPPWETTHKRDEDHYRENEH